MLSKFKNLFKFPCEARMTEAIDKHREVCRGTVEVIKEKQGTLGVTVRTAAKGKRMCWDNLIHGGGL